MFFRVEAGYADATKKLEKHHIIITDILRNVDSFSEAPIKIYLQVDANGKRHRVPENGFITLNTLEKVKIGHRTVVTSATPWETTNFEIFDDKNHSLGKIGFNPVLKRFQSSTDIFYNRSSCKPYTYTLNSVYPYPQFPTYVPRNTFRMKCLGSGEHYLEINFLYDP